MRIVPIRVIAVTLKNTPIQAMTPPLSLVTIVIIFFFFCRRLLFFSLHAITIKPQSKAGKTSG